jgi:hypothetical protein
MRIFITLLIIVLSVVVTTCSLYNPQQLIVSELIDKNLTSLTSSESESVYPSVLQVEQIKTIPNKVHVGDEFSINATVKNTGMYPVTFIADLCDSELYAVFDNKVEEIRAPECKMMSEPVILNAGEQVIVQRISGISGLTYKALEEGQSDAKVILPYKINISKIVTVDSLVGNKFNVTINQEPSNL